MMRVRKAKEFTVERAPFEFEVHSVQRVAFLVPNSVLGSANVGDILSIMPVRTFPNGSWRGGNLVKDPKSKWRHFPGVRRAKIPVILIFFKSNLVESFESFIFLGVLPFKSTTGTIFPKAITLSQSPLLFVPCFQPGFPNHILTSNLFPPGNSITEATMESTLLEAIQQEEVMTKQWDCKLMFKEEQDGPEIDLLDYVHLSEQE
jgi:hypothetical protein